MKRSPYILRLAGILLALFVLLGDQLSKSAVVAAAHSPNLPIVITPFFNLVLVWNRGISFGLLGSTHAWVPHALTFALSLIVLVLIGWLWRAGTLPIALAVACIIGGAIGNILDRIRHGAVTDFLDFHLGVYHWPAFNVADSAIFIGVVILLYISIYSSRPEA
jgi:signal peptidase II